MPLCLCGEHRRRGGIAIAPDPPTAPPGNWLTYRASQRTPQSYWDGGYVGNPLLAPLVADPQSRDLLIVQINPIYRDDVPRQGVDILNRINEISFNSALIKELRAIAYLKSLIRQGNMEEDRHKDVFFHRINADPELGPLGPSSKLNSEWAFFTHLHDVGHRTASDWLDENFEALGNRSTLDVGKIYF